MDFPVRGSGAAPGEPGSAAPDFYDYTAAPWFRPTAEAGQRQVAGPYVDHACTGEYTLTLSTPVPHRDRPLGVAAAGVLVASLEPLALPAMAGLGYPIRPGRGRRSAPGCWSRPRMRSPGRPVPGRSPGGGSGPGRSAFPGTADGPPV